MADRIHRLEQLGNFGLYKMDFKEQHWTASANLKRLLQLEGNSHFPVEDFYKMIRKESMDHVMREIELCIQTGKDVELNYTCILPAGKEISVYNRGKVFHNAKKSAAKIEGLIFDISPLTNSFNFETGGGKDYQLFSKIAHDLNTSITTIALATELIETGNEQEQNESLMLIREVCGMLNKRISELKKIDNDRI